MSVSSTPTPTPESVFGIINLREFVLIIVIATVAIVVERFISTYLSRLGKKAHVEPHVINSLMLFCRILILLFAVAALANVGGLPPEWILSISAIGGAAVGFASQKTLGNFIAGLFLFMAHPFRVGDYVRLGNVEGVVKEITLNYTKVFTIASNTVAVSNLQILDRDITNFVWEPEKAGKAPELYCYTFEIGFDHNVPSEKIQQIFEDVFKNHLPELPKKPEYVLLRSGAFERVYMVYLYVRTPENIFKFRPLIADEVFRHWDQERAKLKT